VRQVLWVSLAIGVCGCASLAAPEEKPVTLYKGLGVWHHPIATSSSEAQKYFDQGLTLAFSFNRYEALRSFRRAAEMDPSAAMAFWGVAMAQGPYINMDGDPSFDNKGACAAVERGNKIVDAPENEKAYLRVAASWCPEFKPDAYIEAGRQLAAEYPDDLDAQTIYADSIMVRSRWHWYDASGKAAPGMPEAEMVLQNVIRRWPQHPGANHLYIHAVEASPTPERGIASAQRLMGIVPWAGHMVHMPGHIWLVLGDWETATTVNERAVAVDREYFKTTGINGGTYEPYYLHNLHFIVYARSMQGRRAQALQAAEELANESGEMAHEMPEMADAFASPRALTYARFNAWDKILSVPPSEGHTASSKAVWSYARTLALSATSDANGAKEEQAHFEKLRSAVPASTPFGQSSAQDVLHVASEVLAARLSSTPTQACEHWRRAVELQDHLTYDEPPDWYYPLRESHGASLLQVGKAAEAAQVFREGVRRSPRNGRMLFGLWQSLLAEGKKTQAESVKREFDAAWASADVTLRIEDL
jgi:tetratricopeptide (TPR) repeat protein